MSEEIDKLLKESTGILMAIDELHNELPKIQKSKEQIDKYVQEFKESMKNATMLIEKNDKNIAFQKDKIANIIEQGENNIKKMQVQINKSLEKYENIDNYVNDLNAKIVKIEEIQKKIILEIKKLQGINKDKNLENVFNIDIILDYIHPRTIQYLYEKYKNTNVPIIVRKSVPSESSPKVWSDNYCFHVEKIEDSKAVGSYYENGKKKIIKGQSSPNIKTQSYVLYGNKDEVDAIVRSLKG